MKNIEIHSKPEQFKYGWVAGFYDALSDDGLRYMDDILRHGPRDRNDKAFIAGYRAGRSARLGQTKCYPETAMRSLRTAA